MYTLFEVDLLLPDNFFFQRGFHPFQLRIVSQRFRFSANFRMLEGIFARKIVQLFAFESEGFAIRTTERLINCV